ncbi:MAG: MBL fold metallo-hydrolase [Candidatus Marinimicrobia bacterium]|jgi:glyoxylase-like metal-dependent hydrolase (beta-lactamase superfamily II)|nr:MBL fold metallo-hydrolase [Candidatus Neomarinimicrobiota bacterium]MBT3938019.1 MBL fold metallo-hydrolase [Candidatus Neomarinimicrobiota bacterium]MBT3961569.1 MBL fold metallo-hydrolase [Candidatus Neomarinimicrobiota bacterium]MBT4382043.1 MBL fold metallo-hydrolase [Candidatus Neomarinimicrobiota bacterium]MBT4636102.1 MBL fold metallo-hydrolase [Candidatus Neomarinimicrobiota bacterium]
MILVKEYSIRSAKGGYDDNFSYLVTCSESGQQCIIDPALPYDNFKSFINGALSAIIITHTHGDHIAHLKDYIRTNPKAVILSHPMSKSIIQSKNNQAVYHLEEFKMGQLMFQFIHTPGHYTDSICATMKNILFTGDTLFVGRTGRVLSPGSNINDLYDSVYNQLLKMNPDTIIYPGHDYGNQPSISLKENISISPLLQAESEQDFIHRMDQYEKNRSNGW